MGCRVTRWRILWDVGLQGRQYYNLSTLLGLSNNHVNRDIFSNDNCIVSDFYIVIIGTIIAHICLLPLSNSSVSIIFG
jgi:hypothetical protein